jgi:hypothetical protein
MTECVALVKSNDPNANGATMSNPANGGSSFSCYKEMGQTGDNGSSSWVNCEITPGQVNVDEGGENCNAYSVGDGTGGTEANLGTVSSMTECVELVRSSDPNANGATMSNPANGGSSFSCYKELGQTGDNDSTSWVNCEITPAPSDEGGENCNAYSVGDGTGGTEANLGTVSSMTECVELVRSSDPNANGATMSNPANGGSSFSCYKELGQTGDNDSTSWVNCEITPGSSENDTTESSGGDDTTAESSSDCDPYCTDYHRSCDEYHYEGDELPELDCEDDYYKNRCPRRCGVCTPC